VLLLEITLVDRHLSHTTDFITFTTPQIYIGISGTPVIDLTILPLGGTSYARFIKNENLLRVWEERSTNGLFGTWTRVGSSTSYLTNLVTEGPLTFQDNTVANRVYTFLDEYGGDSTAKVGFRFSLYLQPLPIILYRVTSLSSPTISAGVHGLKRLQPASRRM